MKKSTILILVGMIVLISTAAFAGNLELIDKTPPFTVVSVPEPTSLILMATGAVGLIGLRKKKRNR
jgi:hypothetical protein